MNAVNRFVMVILLLVVMLSCSVLLIAPVPMLKAVAKQSTAIVEALRPLKWYQRELPGAIIALVWVVVLVLVLILELRRPNLKFIRAQKISGGEVQVSVVSIADRLRYEIDQLASVLRTKPKVMGRRHGVVVKLEVEMAAGIDVPEKANLIVETARQVVEDKMGLKLVRPPKVDLRTVPYPRTSIGQPGAPAEPEKPSPDLRSLVEEPGEPFGPEGVLPDLPVLEEPRGDVKADDDLPALLEG